MRVRLARAAGLLALVGAALLLAGFLGVPRAGRDVDVPLTVEKFAFSPPRVSVEAGDRVTFRIRSLDITHGFAVEGTGVTATILPGREVRVTVPAGQPGKIRYRCSVICGPLHPFMVGEIVVEPNRWPLWGGGLVAVVGFLASAGVARPAGRRDLLRWRPLGRLLARRPFQFALIAPNLLVFTLIVLAGLVGTRETTWTWVPLGLLPWVQLGLLLAGLWGSVRAARHIVTDALGEAGAGRRGLLPVAGFLGLLAWAFLALYLG
jgi:plastocyanin